MNVGECTAFAGCGRPAERYTAACAECHRELSRLQLLIPRRPWKNCTVDDFRRSARWWELEARRGYDSTPDSLQYAANMRWAAERRRTLGFVGPWSLADRRPDKEYTWTRSGR